MADNDPAASPRPSGRPDARIAWVDHARGLAIVLVVVGHVISGLLHLPMADARRAAIIRVAMWIYEFHMPAFFLMAGMFAPASLRKGTRRFLADKAATIVYPYFLWGIGQTIVQAALAPYVHNPVGWRDLVRFLDNPPMQFWFLYVLALAFAAYALCATARVGAPGLLALALVVGALARARGFHPTSVPFRFGDQAPFFAAGALLNRRAADVARAPTPLLVAVALAGAAINTALVGLAPIPPYPAQLLLAIPGIALLVAVAALLARLGGPAILPRLGRLSLEIYLVHVLAYAAVRVALAQGLGVFDPYIHLALGTVAGLAVPVALAALAGRLGFPYLFRWPLRRPSPRETAPAPTA